MKHDFHMVIERDEEGWLVGSVPALPGCHTQAQTLDELRERMQEAIEGYLDTYGDDLALTEFVGIQKITIGA
ncbi:MAG: type II toxin-antitoxin system HicB family antitoxin [Candidatus Hydrogenedentes bacterium]|nr:type II toxin-antitoxin system HicB family antitoxin [Candidatus Hydrogenedentota bacterium]